MARYLKWDGRCFDTPLTADPASWCNADVQPKPPGKPPVGVLMSSLGPQGAMGVSASAQRAEVCIISVDPAFAPIEEYTVIEVEFKEIEKAGCLVVQIRDADDKLVYAERLTREQIGGLPESFIAITGAVPPLAAGGKPLDKAKRKARKAQRWAHPAASPYKVQCWITNKVCADKTSTAEIALDVSAEVVGGADYLTKSTTKAALTSTAPFPAADQTSVRLVSDFSVELVPWPQLFQELTDEDYPADHGAVAALPDRAKKVMFIKCRLNELGFHAGPIDDDETNVDFLKAVRRYGTMRAIDGKRAYKDLGDQPAVLDFDDKNKVLLSPATQIAKLAGLEPDGYPVDSLLEHLKRERKLVKDPPILRLADTWAMEPARVILEANRYYAMANEDEIGKSACETEWFSRPHLPMRARALVRCRSEFTSPVYLPEVLREARFTWKWEAGEEDLKLLPDPATSGFSESTDFNFSSESSTVYREAKYRSQARKYLEETKRQIGAKLGAHANARVKVGGIVTGTPTDDYPAVFGPADRNVPVEKDDGSKTVTTVGPLVYFKPSNIAGDSYELRVSFDPKLQKDSGGGALSGQRQGDLAKLNPIDRLAAKTRKMVGWRKLRIAAFVNWPEQEGKPTWDGKSTFKLDAMLKGMQKEYSFAYIDIGPSQPGATKLKAYKPGELKLDPADHVGGVLKTSTLKVKYESLQACIDDFLATEAVKVRDGRLTYLLPGGVSREPDAFSERAVLPRLEVRPLVVDPTDHVAQPVPPAGVLPSVSRVVKYLLEAKLNALLKNAKSNFYSPLLQMAEPQAAFQDILALAEEWRNTPLPQGEAPEMTALRGEVRKAGAWIVAEILKVVRISPSAAAVAPLGRAGKITKEQAYFQWIDNNVPAPTLAYVEAPVFAYDQALFPALMNLLLVPEAGARHELAFWAAGGNAPERKAPRTASTYNLLAYIAHAQPALASPDFFIFDAINHYKTWLGSLLETLPTGKKYCDGNKLKDVPVADRKLSLYTKTPFDAECMILENAVGGSMTSLGNRWALPFDEVVRKGLGCRRDADGDYVDFADGMIILNALVNEPVLVAGKPYTVAGTSVGSPLGLVFVCQTTAMEPYALFAHELAHVLFMDHFQNAAGLIYDHDHSDANCAMSYPLIEIKDAEEWSKLTPAHIATLDNLRGRYGAKWEEAKQTLASPDKAKARHTRVEIGNIDKHNLSRVYRPHFCGKCNLKLRGWDIYAEDGGADLLPLHSGTPFPATAPFLAAPAASGPPKARSGGPAVKLVRGGPDAGAAGEGAVASIPVSYFPSTLTHKSGATFPAPVGRGPSAFKMGWLVPFPTGFGHDADALTDPATFKVDVHDPNCSASSIFVTVEALKPTYDPSGKVTGWTDFGPEKAKRSLQVECRAVPGAAGRFRSRYLRLVVDEADQNALAPTQQGLLVTDLADGDDGDNDKVEILDQKVRATYTDEVGTAVTAESKVGDPGRLRKRIKLFFHLFKNPAVSEADLKKHARRRALRWVRRTYAQAEMSVKVLGFEMLEKPPSNMLTLNGFDRNDFKTNAAKTAGGSTLTLTMDVNDGVTTTTETVVVALTAGKDTAGIADLVVGAIGGKGVGWAATKHVVPPTDGPLEPACDVVITCAGKTVNITAATCNDAALQPWVVEVPVPDLDFLDDEDNMIGGSPTQRRVLRAGTSADDRIDVYVVPGMKIAGRAYPAYSTVNDAKFHPDPQVRRAAIMAYSYEAGKKFAMDGGDQTPYTLAHEIGHVLVDTGHNDAQGELMAGLACDLGRADSPKRIYSGPLKVGFEDMNQLTAPQPIVLKDRDMYARMMAAGAPAVTEDWPRS